MTEVMGILNVTPDSFSDGGKHMGLDAALRQAEKMVSEGAVMLDVGGESTRPGAPEVDALEERRRTEPVVREIVRRFSVTVSIDTQKATVARAALDAGATWINDVSGGRDPQFAKLCSDYNAGIILMHMRGTPRDMQDAPSYPQGVGEEVYRYLAQRQRMFLEAGLMKEKIWLDPGIGFGKTLEHNLELIRHVDRFRDLGPVLLGTSRKSFLAKVLGDPMTPVADREAGTLASNLWAASRGVRMLRVHDVGPMVRALKTWEAIEG